MAKLTYEELVGRESGGELSQYVYNPDVHGEFQSNPNFGDGRKLTYEELTSPEFRAWKEQQNNKFSSNKGRKTDSPAPTIADIENKRVQALQDRFAERLKIGNNAALGVKNDRIKELNEQINGYDQQIKNLKVAALKQNEEIARKARADREAQQKAAYDLKATERQELLDQLNKIDSEAGYITTSEQSDNHEAKRKEVLDKIDALDAESGVDARYYTAKDRFGGILNGWGARTAGSYTGVPASALTLGNKLNESNPIADNPYAGWATDELTAQNMAETLRQHPEAGGQIAANKAEAERLTRISQDYIKSAAEKDAKAKNGVGAVGRIAMDAVSTGLDVLSDAALAILTGVPGTGLASMAARVFGQTSQQSQMEGDDIYTATAKGMKSAAIEVISEKIGGPFESAYGKSLVSKIGAKIPVKIGTVIDKIVKSIPFKMTVDSMGEAFEEGFSDVMNIAADHLFKWDDGTMTVVENIVNDKDDILYDMLLGGIVGMFGASTKAMGVAEADKNIREVVNRNVTRPETQRVKAQAQIGADVQERSKAQAQINPDAERAKAQAQIKAQETEQKPTAPKPDGTETVNPATQARETADVKAQAENEVKGLLNTRSEESGKVSGTNCDKIIKTPELKAAFERISGEKLEGSMSEMRKTIRQVADESFGIKTEQSPQETSVESDVNSEGQNKPSTAMQAQGDIQTPPKAANAVTGVSGEFNTAQQKAESVKSAATVERNPETGDYGAMAGSAGVGGLGGTNIDSSGAQPNRSVRDGEGENTEIAGYSWYNNDVEYGQKPKLIESSDVTSEPADINEALEEVFPESGKTLDTKKNKDGKRVPVPYVDDWRNAAHTDADAPLTKAEQEAKAKQNEADEAKERLGDKGKKRLEGIGERLFGKRLFLQDHADLIREKAAAYEKTQQENKEKGWKILEEYMKYKPNRREQGILDTINKVREIGEGVHKVASGEMTTKQFSELYKTLGDDKASGTSRYYYDKDVDSYLEKVVHDEDAANKLTYEVEEATEELQKAKEKYEDAKEDASIKFKSQKQADYLLSNLNKAERKLDKAQKKYDRATKAIVKVQEQYKRDVENAFANLEHRIDRADEHIMERAELNKELCFGENYDMKRTNNVFKGYMRGTWKNKFLRSKAISELNPRVVFKTMAGFSRKNCEVLFKLADMADRASLDKTNKHRECEKMMKELTSMPYFEEFVRGETAIRLGIEYNTEFEQYEKEEMSEVYALSLLKALETENGIEHAETAFIELPAMRESLDDPVENEGETRQIKISKDDAEHIIKQIHEHMETSPVMKAAYEKAGDVMEYLAAEGNSVSMLVDGYERFTQGRSYWPLETARKHGAELSETRSVDSVDKPGFLESRAVSHGDGIGSGIRIRPFMETLLNTIERETDYIAKAEMIDKLEILNRKFSSDELSTHKEEGEGYDRNKYVSFRTSLNEHLGSEYLKWLDNWILDLKGQRQGSTSKTLAKLRNAVATSSLVLNVGTWAKQIGDYWNFENVVDRDIMWRCWRPNYYVGNLFGKDGFSKGDLGKLIENVSKYTNVLDSRAAGYTSVELGDYMSKKNSFSNKFISKFPEGFTSMLSKADYSTAANGMFAVSQQVMKDNPSIDINSEDFYKLVADKFEKAILVAQPVYEKSYRPDYLRDPNDWKRGMSMFRTQQSQELSARIEAYGELSSAAEYGDTAEIEKAKKHLHNTLRGQFMSHVLLAAATTLTSLGLKRKDFKDEETGKFNITKFAADVGIEYVKTAAGIWWFGDYAASLAIDFFSGMLSNVDDDIEPRNELYNVSGGAEGIINNFLSSLESFGEKPGVFTISKLATTGAACFGVPLKQIYNYASALSMYIVDAVDLNPKNYNDVCKYIDSILKMDDEEKASFTVDKAMVAMKEGHYERAGKFLDLYDENLGKAMQEIYDSNVYQSLDKDKQRDIIGRVKKYAKARSKENVGESEDDDFETWMTELSGKEQGKYLVASAAASDCFDKNNKYAPIYEKMDDFMEIYSGLSMKARDVLTANTRYSVFDRMYEARARGFNAEDFYKGYDMYKKYNGISITDDYKMSDKYEDFHTELMNYKGLSNYNEKQKEWLFENLKMYTQVAASSDRYDRLISPQLPDSNFKISAEKANRVMDGLGALKPYGEHKEPRQHQEYEYIAESGLTGVEMWAAFFAISHSDSHTEQGLDYYNRGCSYQEFVEKSACCNPKDKWK